MLIFLPMIVLFIKVLKFVGVVGITLIYIVELRIVMSEDITRHGAWLTLSEPFTSSK